MMPHEAVQRPQLAVRVYDALNMLPSRYSTLFARCTERSVFLTLPWLLNYERHVLPKTGRARIFGVEGPDEGAPPVAALLTQEPRDASAWAGRSLGAMANYYCGLYEPIVHPDCRDVRAMTAALQPIVEAFARDTPAWDTLVLQPLDLNYPACRVLEALLRRRGFLVDRFFCFGNWYLEVCGKSYAEYFSGRPKRLTQNVPRSRRRLETSGRMRFEIVNSRRNLDMAKAAYHAIYSESWKQTEPFPGFIDGLLDTAADQGWLRLGVIHVDGIPAAAQIWLVAGTTASIFKMAYDQRFQRESVGTVLSSYLMEHVIDVDKVSIVDYLSGDDEYKRDWMSHRRERWGLIAINPRSVRGLSAAARHFGGRTWRRFFPAGASTGAKSDFGTVR